ncbi:FAD-dependent glycerol-3-phosphate dehydrogenase [Besnoitia besnoiti]|uniref:Glycerol-3-phosphate dehydrogenase n=1 Tax=Besnoitia besnoiti TaxID=94643 RepID=A0A2A9MGQ2_BESBE|nr:FAD-dependent glycerol-3-phosphate dehydrogenase [Besnoitia besnoiti]PFH37698.1 FAD-dependent glycerol-3-phosphate dehydrogenase [Besnoitia besnoiti]
MRRFARVLTYTAGLIGTGGAAAYAGLYYNHQRSMAPKDTRYYASLAAESAKKGSTAHLPSSREAMIERMKRERFDVLVIGGGATGSGVALDAATRGLSCCLLERDDFGGGTSSRSTKLIHGGIRYLEKAFEELDFRQLYLVWEALEERAHMLSAAPYMNQPLAILMPIYKYWQVPYFWMGVKAYGLLSKLVCCFQTGVPPSSYFPAATSRFSFPLLPEDGLKGALLYFDGQMNDSRMNLQIALTSTLEGYVDGMKGAAVANHIQVVALLKDEEGKLTGARVRDSETGSEFDIHSKTVVNCTGPFSDEVRQMADPATPKLVEPAAGIHIVLPHWYTSASPYGLLLPKTTDGRVLFMLPWQGRTVAGTTDAPCELSTTPEATEEEVSWVTRELASYLKVDEAQIRGDIQAVWKGIRPLISHVPKAKHATDAAAPDSPQAEQVSTANVVRSHYILVDDDTGLVSVLGGKWTTYRRMAEETVDALLSAHRDKVAASRPCRTKGLLIQGSVDPTGAMLPKDCVPASGALELELEKAHPELSFSVVRHLVTSYGFLARSVCEVAKEDPELFKPLVRDEDLPCLKAEVVYSVRHEMARSVSDVLARRTRLAFLDVAKAEACIDEVARLMAKELNWDSAQLQQKKQEAAEFLKTFRYRPATFAPSL